MKNTWNDFVKPIVVLGVIWLHYKNRRDLREEMKRMDLQDLE